MREREFKLNLALSPSSNLVRLHRYIGERDRGYKPTAKGRGLQRRNARRIRQGRAAWTR